MKVTHKAEQMIQNNHYNTDLIHSIGENVTARWQQLIFLAEERMKLIMASMNWFKTAEQVINNRNVTGVGSQEVVLNYGYNRFENCSFPVV